jgi:hypothetical protein
MVKVWFSHFIGLISVAEGGTDGSNYKSKSGQSEQESDVLPQEHKMTS